LRQKARELVLSKKRKLNTAAEGTSQLSSNTPVPARGRGRGRGRGGRGSGGGGRGRGGIAARLGLGGGLISPSRLAAER